MSGWTCERCGTEWSGQFGDCTVCMRRDHHTIIRDLDFSLEDARALYAELTGPGDGPARRALWNLYLDARALRRLFPLTGEGSSLGTPEGKPQERTA